MSKQTTREAIAEMLRSWRGDILEERHCYSSQELANRILAECREREKAAWNACYSWVCRQAMTGCLPGTENSKDEVERRYGEGR